MTTTNNTVNAPFPLSAAQGGLGVASPTAHGILVAEGSSAATPIVLGAGQVLIGTTASDPSAATISSGTGITVTSSSGSISIAATGAGAFTWNAVSGTTQAMVTNNGYYITSGSLSTLTLPVTAAAGTEMKVSGYGAGGWTIAQNASQEIFFGNVHTTVGATGTLSSSNQYDAVSILCTVANTSWTVTSAVGNLTYV